MTSSHSISSASSTVLGGLSAIATFALIELRAAEYRRRVDDFVDAASSLGPEQLQSLELPDFFAPISDPILILTIFAGLVFAGGAIIVGLRSWRNVGNTYLGTTGIVLGSMALLWIGLTALGAV